MIISSNHGRGKKIHLLIDNEYQITTDEAFWALHYIKDGTDVSEEKWEELVDAINLKKAVDKCYDLLSRREHSVKELKTKLLRTVDEKYAELAIDRMLELGYLDDEKYAKKLLDYLIEVKKMSKNHIKQEMYKRGVPLDIIADTLCDVEVDNVSNIVDLLNTKYRTKLNADNGKDKVIASLMRKGFTYGDIKSAFDKLEIENY